MHGEAHAKVDVRMRECIDQCQRCHATCTEMVTYCLEMGGEHARPAHIGLLLDCAQICQTSADFLLRSSDLHGKTCDICALVCETCADDCDRFGDDEMMRECAEVCRSCARSCREMGKGI